MQILVSLFVVSISFAEPMKLLRKPKIYNALITTKQNLLPSEAFPASTGPVFEPIGLSGEPVLLNPEAFVRARLDAEESETVSNATEGDNQPRPFSKMPQPIVFYPRYNVYHQYPSPLLPFPNIFQQPILYEAKEQEPMISYGQKREKQIENEGELQTNAQPDQPTGFDFVTNNSPKNSDIPNVPPPPPPLGAPRPQAKP